jgi:hypothetical protein
VVLCGRLRRAALDGDADARAEQVMEPGPSTVRADLPVDKLEERMRRRDLRMLLERVSDLRPALSLCQWWGDAWR